MTADDTQTIVKRLQSWTEDVILGRTHLPTYANPGELKQDVRDVLAALDRLAAENEFLRMQLDSQTENAFVFLMKRDAAEAENERLRAALTKARTFIDPLDSRWEQVVTEIDAALAGGVGARWKEGKARVLCQRSNAPVGWTGPICSCGAMCAAGGVGDTAAPCPDCGREWGKHDPLCSLAGDTAA